MFAEKKTQIFDARVFRVGSFITLMVMDYDSMDGLHETYSINGIISYCAEDYFILYMCDGTKKKVDIEHVFKGDDTDGYKTRYKIQGIAHSIERKEIT